MITVAWCLVSFAALLPWWWRRGYSTTRLVWIAQGVSRRGGGSGSASGTSDPGVVLGLLAAAVQSGASVPRALDVVGRSIGGSAGRELMAVSAKVTMGASWAEAWHGTSTRWAMITQSLGPTWEYGVAPREALRTAAIQLREAQHAQAVRQAATLGVRLALPLGLCFLPAFVLVGLVPLAIALSSGVWG